MNLKTRLLIIFAVIAASVWALFPRSVVERKKDSNGTFVYDTVKRVPLKYGLDLQGGIHLALEIDDSKGTPIKDKKEAIERALTVVRNRIDEFGVAEPVVQKVGDDRIIVELPGIEDPRRAEEVVQKNAFLQFQITDETRALERALPRIDGILKDKKVTVASSGGAAADTAKSEKGLQSLFVTDSNKKDTTKAAGPTDTTKSDSIVTGGALAKLIQPGQTPGEYFVAEKDVNLVKQYFSFPEVQAALPPSKVVRWSSDTMSIGAEPYRPFYVLDARPIITGEYLEDAKPNRSPTDGVIVEFQFNNEGGRRFRNETGKHVQDFMAIVLDDIVMGRPPVIQTAIGRRGQITMGNKDLQSAQDLASVLRAGALPVPLKIVEARTIGSILGQDSIEKGKLASIIAIAFIVLALLIYYKMSGFYAVVGVAIYVLITLAALASFGAVLTFPGIAGFVLSIGMAVDANVLQFERIREELDRGRTARAAIDEGFKSSLPAIVDSNVATALTAAVLYQFGTGAIRGFAVTLLAGMISSMFSAVFVVRTLYMLWLSSKKNTAPASISI